MGDAWEKRGHYQNPNSTKYDACGWNISRSSHCRQLHGEISQSKQPKGKKPTVWKSISSIPRTKDTWGLFDKPRFKETPHASALPAVHWIKQWLVLWNPSQHLVLAAICQVNSRGSSCLGATVWLPPPWTKKQELEPIVILFQWAEGSISAWHRLTSIWTFATISSIGKGIWVITIFSISFHFRKVQSPQ